MKTFYISAALAALVSAQGNSDRQEFLDYLANNSDLQIDNQNDFHRRFGLYKATKARVKAMGGNGQKLNKFAAWTADEKAKLNGINGVENNVPVTPGQGNPFGIVKYNNGQGSMNNNGNGNGRRLGSNNPVDSIYWDEDITGPIESQGQCGSCWAFASLTHVESLQAIRDKARRTDYRLSRQNFVNCSEEKNYSFTKQAFSFYDKYDYLNRGCQGGGLRSTYDFLQNTGAIPATSSNEYKATEGAACSWDSTKTKQENFDSCSCKWNNQVEERITSFEFLEYNNSTTAYDIANALKDGPLSITIKAGDSTLDYNGGILEANDQGCDANPNHMVVLVGFYPGGDAVDPMPEARLLSESAVAEPVPDESRFLQDTEEEQGRDLQSSFEWTVGDTYYYCRGAYREDFYYGCDPYQDPSQDWWLARDNYGYFYCCYQEELEPEPTPEPQPEPEQPTFDASDYQTYGTFDASNVVEGEAYWIIKNSWGTWWGDQGYQKVKFSSTGEGWCGMYQYAIKATV